jgi:hypothetical protein
MSLAAGEVTCWERAAHREEESRHETHFLGRADPGLDSSRLGRRCRHGAELAGMEAFNVPGSIKVTVEPLSKL